MRAQRRYDALAPAPLGVDPDVLRAALQALAFASQELHVVPRFIDLAANDAVSVALAAAQRTELVARSRGGGAGTIAAVPRRYIDAHALHHQLAAVAESEHEHERGAAGGAKLRDGGAAGEGAARERVLPVFLFSLDAARGEAPLLLGSGQQRAAVALPGMVIAVQTLPPAYFAARDYERRGAGDDRAAPPPRNLRDPSDEIVAAAATVLFDLPAPSVPCLRGGWCLAPSAQLVSDAAKRAVARRCVAASYAMVGHGAALLREMPRALLRDAAPLASRPHLRAAVARAGALLANVTRRCAAVRQLSGTVLLEHADRALAAEGESGRPRETLLDAVAHDLSPLLRESRELLGVARELAREYRAIECAARAAAPKWWSSGALVATLGALGGALLAARSGGGGRSRASARTGSAGDSARGAARSRCHPDIKLN